jgi:hypothetical protein
VCLFERNQEHEVPEQVLAGRAVARGRPTVSHPAETRAELDVSNRSAICGDIGLTRSAED